MSNYPLSQPDRILKPEPVVKSSRPKKMFESPFKMWTDKRAKECVVPILFKRTIYTDVWSFKRWADMKVNLQLPKKTVTLGQCQRECQASGLDLSLAKDDTQRKLDELIAKVQFLTRLVSDPYWSKQYQTLHIPHEDPPTPTH